jgi:hypothetical protein
VNDDKLSDALSKLVGLDSADKKKKKKLENKNQF